MNSALRAWRTDRTNPRWTLYKTNRNIYFHTIHAAKEQHWHSFLAEAQDKVDFTALRFTKLIKIECTLTLQGTGDQAPATMFEQTAKLFRATLFPPPPTVRLEAAIHAERNRIPWQTSLTNNKIAKAILELSASNAPGPDGLGFKCIQVAYHCIPEFQQILPCHNHSWVPPPDLARSNHSYHPETQQT